MRLSSTRSLTAAAALVAIAAAAGCSDGPADPVAGPPGESTTSSSLSSSPPSSPRSSQAPTSRSSPSAPLPSPGSPGAPGAFIAAATWADSDYGVTLTVAPTPSGREASGDMDATLAWQEVTQLAPDADSPGMREQFDCHWTWARILEPDKPTWNIEPWRPVVAIEQMLAEGCNPGGPEV